MGFESRKTFVLYDFRKFFWDIDMHSVVHLASLNPQSIGQIVEVAGFINSVRDHGEGVFIDLIRENELLQCVFSVADCPKDVFQAAKTLREQSTIRVKGLLRKRPQETLNDSQRLGLMELLARDLEIYTLAEPLPFEFERATSVSEKVLLQHRYLQIRTPLLQRNLRMRHEIVNGLRQAFYAQKFVEVETPTLFKSTPEGARDFLVPSRLFPGDFYALIQSPQMLKQLLMVGGLGRYLQVARCYRDEDSRTDRQPEFTQLDLEMAFADSETVMQTVEEGVRNTFNNTREVCQRDFGIALPKLPEKVLRISYEMAMSRYGSDKPDLRFHLPIFSAGNVLKETAFQTFRNILNDNGFVSLIALPFDLASKPEISRAFLDGLPEFAKKYGSQGLAWIRVQEDGSWQGPAGKFFSETEKQNLLRLCYENKETWENSTWSAESFKTGSMLFFCASKDKSIVNHTLGALRLVLADLLQLRNTASNVFLWVVDWPLLEWDPKEKHLSPLHHPFTSPTQESLDTFMQATPAEIRAKHLNTLQAAAYDLVWNGVEIGGGSQRIHNSDVQKRMFQLLGMTEEEVQNRFGFFVNAFKYGAPPHAGLAIGIDRFIAMCLGENTIRDVIAFPKAGSGRCLMSQCPSGVNPLQLRELSIKTIER